MNSRHMVLASVLACSGIAQGSSLFGIGPTFQGYSFYKINATSGVATQVATLGMSNVVAFNALTYDGTNQRFLAVANMGPSSSYIVAIDPLNYTVTSVVANPGAPLTEGIEYLPWTEQIAMSVGAGPSYTDQLWIHDANLNLVSGWVWSSAMDMDTLFTDGQQNVCHLDVNNAFDSSARHIITNALASSPPATMVPVGTWAIYNGNEYDAAYSPTTNRVYVTRGGNLAQYNANGTSLTDIGNYGGPIITSLAYGAEGHTITGTLVLDDMIPNFSSGVSRTVNWAIKQGTATAASGSLVTSTATVNFSVNLPDSIQGYSIWEWDAGSSLKEKLIIIMPGTSFGFGTVHLPNGDADHSGEADAADIDDVIANFGNTYPGPGNVDADVDGSGEVDSADIDIVIACFGNADD